MKKRFHHLALALLIYTVLVILWGAWVRISHSGDGCGNHWPLCNGELVPGVTAGKTWVEYTHRLMSGLFGIFVTALWIWARRHLEVTHPVRKYALYSFILMITEAALGAKLVLFGLVTDNDSPIRALMMGLHLLNSLMLVAAITSLWEASLEKANQGVQKVNIKPHLVFILIALLGAMASLASTLFPSISLSHGLSEDLSSHSHYLIRLRILHPLVGLLLGSSLAFFAYRKNQLWLSTLITIGILLGILNLVLLSPIWLKLSHLLLAHLIWIQLVLWRQRSHA